MHFNFGSVAHVIPGQIWLCWRGCTIKAQHRGSLRQGMRFAERWIAARWADLDGMSRPSGSVPAILPRPVATAATIGAGICSLAVLLPTLHFVVGTHLWEATLAAVLRPQSTQARRDLQ